MAMSRLLGKAVLNPTEVTSSDLRLPKPSRLNLKIINVWKGLFCLKKIKKMVNKIDNN